MNREKINRVCEIICDDYCRFPALETNEEDLHEKRCKLCPLNWLLDDRYDPDDTLTRAIETYGSRAQTDKAIEEMSELTKALLKLRYCDKDFQKEILQDAVSEEMADTQIMLDQLEMIYDNAERVATYRKEKIDRLKRRIGK